MKNFYRSCVVISFITILDQIVKAFIQLDVFSLPFLKLANIETVNFSKVRILYTLFFFYFLWRVFSKKRSHLWCYILILGGGLGNIIDLFVDTPYFFYQNWYIPQLADIFILSGLGGLLYFFFQRIFRNIQLRF